MARLTLARKEIRAITLEDPGRKGETFNAEHFESTSALREQNQGTRSNRFDGCQVRRSLSVRVRGKVTWPV